MVEVYANELSVNILDISNKNRSGYAIDNTDADDSKIISITEQSEDQNLWDTYVDID